jgi:tRNA(fMet)-specific endonuclease VapC
VAHLLDTNTCIGLIKNAPDGIRSQFDSVLREGGTLLISSLVTFELWYVVAKSQRREVNAERLSNFLAWPIETLAFDEEDSQHAGRIRAQLETKGTPIGAFDLLLAGQAIRHGLTLVTSNTREFSRVPGLGLLNWA